MDIKLKPHKLKGIVNIPSSKSLTHRAIIAASLAEGESIIRNVSYSDDIRRTIDGMKSLGAKIDEFDNYLRINGGYPKRINSIIDAGESGSTLRFLIPLALLASGSVSFIGHNNLVNRPLDSYLHIFDELNIKYERGNDYLPLKINGRLAPYKYKVEGNISSQFITGLLFALPLLDGDSEIIIINELESKGYIALTLDILNKFGINIINNNYKSFIIKGNQKYKPLDYTLEGDYSQAAFFLVMDALGGEIELRNMNINSIQGDKIILDNLKELGCEISYSSNSLSVKANDLKGITISLKNSPDLGPALATLMATIPSRGMLIDGKRLRIKECDRLNAMNLELSKIGAKIIEGEDYLDIVGVNSFDGAIFSSHNDHRVAMSLAILSLICKHEIIIRNAECVNKSYPDFFEVLKALGGDISWIS